MDNSNLLATIAFSHCYGIGPVRYLRLMAHFKSPHIAYTASEKELKKVLGTQTLSLFLSFRTRFSRETKLKEIQQKNIEVIPSESEYFPSQLKAISDPPICIYVKGNKELLKKPIDDFFAVVGSRKTTQYGLAVTEKLVSEISKYKIIVSGMAMGIDTAAHTAALSAHGSTIAVLGCGVDLVCPPSNKPIYEAILNQSGCILSEFPPGQTVMKGMFVARNRIISGLCNGVLVIEGTETSGALITAKYALDQGRELYAVPGPITSSLSNAPNILLHEGATLVRNTQDILGYIRPAYSIPQTISPVERKIVELLLKEPLSSDELAIQTCSSVPEILNNISMLEMKNIITKGQNGVYMVVL